MSNCFNCPDPCEPVITSTCEQTVCNNCDSSMYAKCVFISDKLMCSNGTYYIVADLNVEEAFKQLICKINELETKINFIMQNCCENVVCELPSIISINES